MHLPFIAHTCAHQMYVTITCSVRNVCFALLVDCTDTVSVQDDGDSCESTLKDKLPQPRGSLANNIPSRAIDQAIQEFRQDYRHLQHSSNA